jgi:hypothetical protein
VVSQRAFAGMSRREFLAKAIGAGGIRGPIGLGYRAPCFVISNYCRGWLMVHDRQGDREYDVSVKFAVPPDPSPPNRTFGPPTGQARQVCPARCRGF